VADLKRDKRLWRFSKLHQVKYLDNIVEQHHRRVKRLVRPGLGFKRFWAAWCTLTGYETQAMMRKGQVEGIGRDDIVAQAAFVGSLFDMTDQDWPKLTIPLFRAEFFNKSVSVEAKRRSR
jgi:hypothetical protein